MKLARAAPCLILNAQQLHKPDGDLSPPQLLASHPCPSADYGWLASCRLVLEDLGIPYPWLFLADHKDVRFSSSEGVVDRIFDMHDIESSIMAFSVCDDSYTAHVATTRNHSNDSSIKAYEVGDLARCEFNLDRIIDLNSWIRVPYPVHKATISSPPR